MMFRDKDDEDFESASNTSNDQPHYNSQQLYSSAMRVFLILILFTSIGNQVFSQDTRCLTPVGKLGDCRNIRTCAPLIEILRSQTRDPTIQEYLRNSQCGIDGRDPLVCCPKSSDIESIPGNTPTTPATNNTKATQTSPTGNLPTECGFSDVPHNKVVGGIPAKLYSWPWLALLGYRSSSPSIPSPVWRCGASLISDRHLLTAGHCVYNRRDLYLVRLGELNLDSDDDGASPIDIRLARALIHPDYQSQRYTSDIAIIWMETPVTFSASIHPICLPTSPKIRKMNLVRTYPFIAGWGALKYNGTASSSLQELQVPVVSEEQCKQAYSVFDTAMIDERVLCAGYAQGQKDACQGDSGGPLMSRFKTNTYTQIGVVSYGFKCAEPGFPGVYTKVAHFVDWIVNNL